MNTVSSQPPTKPQFSLPQSMPATPPQEREASYAPAPPAGSRIEGDRELTREYRNALLSTADHRPDAKIHPIPPHSTFGQWWAQLHGAFQSPDVKQWIQDKGIAVGSIRLNPETGQISFSLQRSLDAKQTIHTLGQDDPHWRAISGPILQAARVLAAGHLDTTFAPPVSDIAEPVPYELVGRFYKERLGLTEPAMRKRAEELAETKTFTALDPTTDTSLIASRSESALQDQKSHLGDLVNRQQIVVELQHLAANADAGSIEDQLKTKRVNLASDSTYPVKTHASLQQLLEDHGWDIPTTREEVLNLAKSLSTPASNAPPDGNLGGALNWPVPLDQNSQQQLQADVRAGKFGDLVLSPFGNVLDYLLNGRQISPEEQRDPRKLINELINSPRGKALGQAIQATFEARSVKGSATDWLLAALNVTSSKGVGTPAYSRTPGVIEGYRPVSADNMGKPPATVIQQLANHLVATSKASSPENAVIQAHILLASQAPEFLVKDIPEQVSVGTHSWVSFTTAVARMEAKVPGSTAMASYAQIMLEADIAPITETERAVEYAAQNEAIKQWGVANGMSYPVTETAIKAVREQFTAQVSELKAAAETHVTEMPTVESIALEQLKNAFPDMDPVLFEQKNITLHPSNRHYPGPYSILDLYIDGRALQGSPASADNWGKFGRTFVQVTTLGVKKIDADGKPTAWVSSSSEIDVPNILEKLKQLPRPDALFQEPFSNYANAVKKTTAAHFKYLISKLPPEDRENLEHGKLTPLEEVRYPETNQRDRVADGVLIFQTERNGKATYYEFDRTKGSISKLPEKDYIRHADLVARPSHTGILVERVQREGEHSPGLLDEKTGMPTVQNCFGSARTQYIVNTLIADMNFPAVERYAKGATTFDTEVPVHEKVSKVALDFIPFYSAIKNFKSGNIGGGTFDLTLDIFGFAVGFGSAFAKGAKVVASTASALSKIGKVGRIVGRAALGALNPLDGVDDLGRGALKLGRVATGTAYKGVKSLRGSYQSVNLLELSKRRDIAEGSYKAANGAAESKTLAKLDEATNKWYAYDPITQQTYGKALDNFVSDTPSANAPDSLGAVAHPSKSASSRQRIGLKSQSSVKPGEGAKPNTVISQSTFAQMGGAMNEVHVLGGAVHTYTDAHKGGTRLNVVAHGVDRGILDRLQKKPALVEVDDKHYTAKELVAHLRSKGIDPADSRYSNIRLLICYSADGADNSFAKEFQKEVGKTVKAYEGTVTLKFGSTSMEKIRDYLETQVRGEFPSLAENEIHLLVDSRIQNMYSGQKVQHIEKNNGTQIQINVAAQGKTPVFETLKIEYKPVHFS
ncbi:hypothetical protein [Pseudomonas sp. S09G 359]|uniref:hypothetical protein n=1 Tax=Pseudomonas sp. S09G 359 TaxID=2054919 RepID=UPI000C6DEA98|nr:hypothetical protein [Pseudomonas sp. S09G 359]AUG07872.1 hypothetical protein CXQ82_15245 [Pseudomonas sp. S09G 359]